MNDELFGPKDSRGDREWEKDFTLGGTPDVPMRLRLEAEGARQSTLMICDNLADISIHDISPQAIRSVGIWLIEWAKKRENDAAESN